MKPFASESLFYLKVGTLESLSLLLSLPSYCCAIDFLNAPILLAWPLIVELKFELPLNLLLFWLYAASGDPISYSLELSL